jgi:hypothetical protein
LHLFKIFDDGLRDQDGLEIMEELFRSSGGFPVWDRISSSLVPKGNP